MPLTNLKHRIFVRGVPYTFLAGSEAAVTRLLTALLIELAFTATRRRSPRRDFFASAVTLLSTLNTPGSLLLKRVVSQDKLEITYLRSNQAAARFTRKPGDQAVS
jgi:hypothetical protein